MTRHEIKKELFKIKPNTSGEINGVTVLRTIVFFKHAVNQFIINNSKPMSWERAVRLITKGKNEEQESKEQEVQEAAVPRDRGETSEKGIAGEEGSES